MACWTGWRACFGRRSLWVRAAHSIAATGPIFGFGPIWRLGPELRFYLGLGTELNLVRAPNMDAVTKVSGSGKLNLPAQVRRQVGLEQGGLVLVRIEDGEIRIRTVRDSILRLQQRARKLFGGADSVGQFIADRRAEAEREGEGE
jgi:AbrB family looped-hinge helix DNA binding protein